MNGSAETRNYFFGPLVLFFLPACVFLLLPAPLCEPAPAWPAPPRCELDPPAPDSAPLLFGIGISFGSGLGAGCGGTRCLMVQALSAAVSR